MALDFKEIVTIVIPIYKNVPDSLELFSLNRCCTVLFKYPISIVTNEGVDLNIYIDIIRKHKVEFKILYFEKFFFKSLDGYNKLMISPLFYQSFTTFKYILIYQLDAFVFTDQLIYWCNKGYDYIGAPWLHVKWVNKKFINKKLPLFARYPWLFKKLKGKDGLVGNGGFSLRRVNSHLKYSKMYSSFFENLHFNEDLFWGKYVAAKDRSFKIPLMMEALSFSIENDPDKGFRLLDNELPFGCHAWYKKDKKIWQMIFEKAGIDFSLMPKA